MIAEINTVTKTIARPSQNRCTFSHQCFAENQLSIRRFSEGHSLRLDTQIFRKLGGGHNVIMIPVSRYFKILGEGTGSQKLSETLSATA